MTSEQASPWTGVLLTGPEARERVLGLALSLRNCMALQVAGAQTVLVVGEGADLVAELLRRDSRVRCEVRAAEAWEYGSHVVVSASVLVTAPAVRHLLDAGVEAVRTLDARPALRWTHGAGRRFEDLGEPGVELLEGPGLCLHVDGSPMLRSIAERRLLEGLRKDQDGWVSKALNRRISLTLTRGLARLGVHPHVVTGVTTVVGIAAGLLAAQKDPELLALGGIALQAQSVLDGCDGELARVSFRGSKLGEWLDTLGDDLSNYGFVAGLSWSLWALGWRPWAWIVGGLGLFAGLLATGVEYRYLVRIGSGDLGKYPLGFGADDAPVEQPKPWQRVLGALRPALKRDTFVFVTLCACLVGFRPASWLLVVFALGAWATLGAVLASEFRRARTPEA